MSEIPYPIEARIAKLERSNRALLACFAGCAVVLAVVGAGGSADTVRASAFLLVDGDGAVRAEIALKDGNPGLFLKDGNGVDRLLAVHEPDGTGLSINDATGTTRIGVVQFAHGGGGVALHGPDSKGAAVLYLKDQASLRFYDQDGKVVGGVGGPASTPE